MDDVCLCVDLAGMWPSDSCTSNAFYGCERIRWDEMKGRLTIRGR